MSETDTEQSEINTEQSEIKTDQTAVPVTDDVPAEEAGAPAGHVDVAQAERYGRSGDRNYRKVRSGYVVSDKMDKTVTVAIEDHVKHRRYGKIVRQTSKLKAHDEQNTCGVGDRVLLMETRPLSATKRWRVVEILERAK